MLQFGMGIYLSFLLLPSFLLPTSHSLHSSLTPFHAKDKTQGLIQTEPVLQLPLKYMGWQCCDWGTPCCLNFLDSELGEVP